MIHIPDVTLQRLLDHVTELAKRRARGRPSLEPRAYAADAKGQVTTLAFPMPADDDGRRALGALLQSEMRKRGAVMSVLALEASALVGRDEIECLVLEGQQLRPENRTEVRLLRIERVEAGRDISALHPVDAPGVDQVLLAGVEARRA